MSKGMFNVLVCAVVSSAVLAAQDKKMDSMKMDKMDKMAAEKTYTGCLVKSENGGFSLSSPMAADAMKKPMAKDSMKGMAKDSMGKDSMAKDDIGMNKDGMMQRLSLSSSSVDLSKHVGHKVSVKGAEDKMNGMATFSVKSLKMIAASCS
jgi:hypothetical protein